VTARLRSRHSTKAASNLGGRRASCFAPKRSGPPDHPTTSPSLTTPAVATGCRAKVSDRVGFRLKVGSPVGVVKAFCNTHRNGAGPCGDRPATISPALVPRAAAHNQFLPPETHSESLDMCRRPGSCAGPPNIADRVELAQTWIGSSSVWAGPLPGGVLEVGSGCAFSARPAFHRRKLRPSRPRKGRPQSFGRSAMQQASRPYNPS